ncbi:MAG TPA: hypothetical protein VK524_10830, partial [Polyangiaceae bacterium]|nr:hypothetical protein [Polyangiaceae bacterium]
YAMKTSHWLLVATLLLPATAQGQSAWLPVVIDHAESQESLLLLRQVIAALRTEQKIDLPDPSTAARRFEQVHSAQPVELDDAELRRLGDSVGKALSHAALGEWKLAHEESRRFGDLSQAVQDYVKLRLDLSDDVLDYCLMSVDFMLSEGRAEAAREQMSQCIYASPHGKPDPSQHKTNVLELHEEVRRELLGKERSTLSVDVASASTEGCVVVVNGAAKGGLPYRETELLPIATRIQVNCQEPGRIHFVAIKPGRNALVINQPFERVVQTAGYLALRYRTIEEEERSKIADATTLGKLLDTQNVLLVRKAGKGRVDFRRIEVGKLVAQVTLRQDAGDDEIRAGARALVDGLSGDVSAAPKQALVPDHRVDDGDGPNWLAGVAPAAGGATLLGLAWVSYAKVRSARGRYIGNGNPATLTRYEDLVAAAQTNGVAGAALTAASVPSLLPDADGVPVWSWIVGVAGAGVATGGALIWNAHEPCTTTRCKAETDPSLGQLVLLHSTPLLAIPITHAVRALLGSNQVSASTEYSSDAGAVSVGGSF